MREKKAKQGLLFKYLFHSFVLWKRPRDLETEITLGTQIAFACQPQCAKRGGNVLEASQV